MTAATATPATPAVGFAAAVPILRVYDLVRARDFYARFLGFAWDWEHRFEPDLPPTSRCHAGQRCCTSPNITATARRAPRSSSASRGWRAFHAELAARRYAHARPAMADAPWGDRMVSVTDPFGNRLTFHEPVSTSVSTASSRPGA
jgi:catechol 2,3-dioxygenase-like lactoylglutathione lyase family enzyme